MMDERVGGYYERRAERLRNQVWPEKDKDETSIFCVPEYFFSAFVLNSSEHLAAHGLCSFSLLLSLFSALALYWLWWDSIAYSRRPSQTLPIWRWKDEDDDNKYLAKLSRFNSRFAGCEETVVLCSLSPETR